MVDIDQIYASLQFAMVLMLAAMSLVLAIRARAATAGLHAVPSPVVLWLLSAFMLTWAIRLGWWHIRWALRALDLHDASNMMVDRVAVPMAANVFGLIIGGALLAIAGRETLGRAASPLVVSGILVTVAVGAILSGIK